MRNTALASLPLLIVSALAAQDAAPGRSPELQKLAGLVGSWEGEGQVVMQPGMPPAEWTSVENARWVLGGTFLRQDTRIEFGGALPGALQFTVFTGWDRGRGRLRSVEVSNMGVVQVNDLHVLPNGAMVSVVAGFEEGLPTMDRWVNRLEGDTLTMVGHRAVGDGDPFEHVKGTMRRVSAEPGTTEHDDASFMMPPAAEMQRLAAMAGDYALAGSARMPGAGELEITGDSTCSMLFGGTVSAFHTKGQPGNYEAFGYLAWDPVLGSYRSVGVSSMGEIHVSEARFDGQNLVYTTAAPQGGGLMVGRGIMRFDAQGALAGVANDGMAASGPAARVFEATYTKK